MLKKIGIVLGLLISGYLLGQVFALPTTQDDVAAKLDTIKTVTSNVDGPQEAPSADQKKDAAETATTKKETEYLLPNELLFAPSDKVASYALWLGEFSQQSEFPDKLVSSVESLHAVVRLPFLNSLNEKKSILLMGPYTSLSAAQLDQQKLLHELQINTSVVKFPVTPEKTKD